MRILIAEDDREAAAFLSQGLRDIGHDVAVAESGEIARHMGTT